MSTGWESLAASANTGELYLERGVAQRCAAGCNQFLDELRELRDRAAELAVVEGLGDRLSSGVALASKFARKATGGDYSLDRALADHIAIVEQMRTVFEAIESRYAAAEEANATAATAVESQIN
ncbi:hypothetical protein [Rhodococcus sp. SGAir0479]|uniref:hypothetical protein n=1 Tax=Rhodococcus sp. SGAir0479 TaxID=2567884 RepID=UPI0020C7F170|nr:hypothetical protein [Rhodococcus sp. SGAir0479]